METHFQTIDDLIIKFIFINKNSVFKLIVLNEKSIKLIVVVANDYLFHHKYLE